ncbi:hypothetical protein H2198_004626 [Neophaeococcomyces mojaviensis]|uniref:Uncharacterized protein n=1 Tax=Neophaeococcomyces mojaviensis TaxID=3383035 RepID=A0ACC3A885_9EURO|nr:hypothetical protein H2198_004626 [Knufia sp. JES_112]
MPTVPGTYLWVNKNKCSTSLSASKGQEYSLIRGHIQTVCASRRRLRRAQSIASKFSGLKFALEADTNNHNSSPSEDEDFSQNSCPVIIASTADPFRVTTLAVDVHSKQLLTFHVEWWRAVAPDWKVWHEVDLSQPADVVITQKCFRSPLYMLSIITFTSVQMEMLKLPGGRSDLTDALHLKTIWALRAAFNSADHNPMHLLEIISYLCLTEVYKRDFPAARMHLGAVKHFLEVVGGVSNVLNYASEMFLFSDYYLALSVLTQPILGHRVDFNNEPPVSAPDKCGSPHHSILSSDWVQQLPQEILKSAVQQLFSCTYILQQSWTDPKLIINGYWVRKKCVSIIICLLDAWNFEDMPSQSAESARISILLWSVFVLASTLDTQGAKTYIPTFDGKTIDRYNAIGMTRISSALTKWNQILGHDFGLVPPGCDILLRFLFKVPSGIESSSGVFLSDLMDRFAAAEESRRLEKATRLTQDQLGRALQWRLWRTSILLC